MHTKRFCRGVSDEKFVLGHSDGPGIIAEVLKRQKRVPGGSEKETGGWKQRLEWYTLKMQGRDHKPKNASDLWKLEKAKK